MKFLVLGFEVRIVHSARRMFRIVPIKNRPLLITWLPEHLGGPQQVRKWCLSHCYRRERAGESHVLADQNAQAGGDGKASRFEIAVADASREAATLEARGKVRYTETFSCHRGPHTCADFLGKTPTCPKIGLFLLIYTQSPGAPGTLSSKLRLAQLSFDNHGHH
jgi:hypothetical protein